MDENLDLETVIQFIAWERVPVALLILVLGWLGMSLLDRFLDDLGERLTDWRLTLKKVRALTRFSLYLFLGVAIGSSVLVLDSRTMFALAGSLGLAVGWAFKDLLASLVTGVIVLIDEPFQVGDRIAFGGYYGEVTEIGLRSVRLATLDDNLVTIPNSKFLSDIVASANAGALHAMVVVPFYVSAGEDFWRARQVVAEAAATSRYVYLDMPVVTLVSDEFMGERFVTVIKLKAYVFDVRYEKAFASDVTERVKRALRDAGIRTPDQAYRDLEVFGHEAPHTEVPHQPSKGQITS